MATSSPRTKKLVACVEWFLRSEMERKYTYVHGIDVYVGKRERERERFERRRFRKIRKETRIENLRRLLAHTIRLAMGRAYGQGKSFCSSRLFSVFTRTTVQRICTHASLRQEITFSFLGREWYFADERNRTFRSGRVPFTHGWTILYSPMDFTIILKRIRKAFLLHATCTIRIYIYIYSIGIVHHKSLAITFFFRREKVRKEEKEKKKREVGLKTLG